MPDFADRLKMVRKMRDLSLADLADQLGTTKQTLSRYELRRRYPKSVVVSAYAKKLNVDPAWLMGYDDPEKPKSVNKETLCKMIERLNDSQIELLIGVAQNMIKAEAVS